MSIRTIIEINHDYLRRFKPEQFRELLYALGSSSVTELLNRGGGKPIDWTSGIRILGQRHHSEPEWQQMSEQDEATSLERRATAKFANCKWCGLERENAGPAKGCPTGYRCAHLNAEESKAMHDNPELFEARRRVSRLLADRGIYLYHTMVDEIVAAARGVTTARPVPDSVEHYGLIDERSPQGQAQAAALGVMAAPASLEIIGWQWRRIGQPWPEKLLNFEPSVTTADSEKRAIYAGPTITYGVTTCPACNGSGDHGWEGKCETCDGKGTVPAGVRAPHPAHCQSCGACPPQHHANCPPGVEGKSNG